MNNKISIFNTDESILVSDILQDMLKMSTIEDKVVTERKTIEGTKGAIITAIVLGIATNAAYDLLKTILLKHKNRADYNPNLKISIEGKEYTLEYIKENNSTEISLKRK